MQPGEAQAQAFHEVYAKHFKVFYPLAQQFPSWEQLSEREKALMVATCRELAKSEADTLVHIMIASNVDGNRPASLEAMIDKRIQELGYYLCSKWDTEQRAYRYYLSIPDPALWKEPTNNG